MEALVNLSGTLMSSQAGRLVNPLDTSELVPVADMDGRSLSLVLWGEPQMKL